MGFMTSPLSQSTTRYRVLKFQDDNGLDSRIVPSRILGLSYPEYLKLFHNLFPDKTWIINSLDGLPILVWEADTELFTLLRLLNKKYELVTKNAE